jgi:hypothetical protein
LLSFFQDRIEGSNQINDLPDGVQSIGRLWICRVWVIVEWLQLRRLRPIRAGERGGTHKAKDADTTRKVSADDAKAGLSGFIPKIRKETAIMILRRFAQGRTSITKSSLVILDTLPKPIFPIVHSAPAKYIMNPRRDQISPEFTI